ncbi:unnamed protein product [Lymnaea stagnalis]|uniref:Methyltransferase domain-containing protein n=1 Tax=Lymnaea stagnalis TaxID=6523 RepID=A0AAV2IF59_LYMST
MLSGTTQRLNSRMVQSSVARWVFVVVAMAVIALLIVQQNSVYKGYLTTVQSQIVELTSTLNASDQKSTSRPGSLLVQKDDEPGPLKSLRQKARGSGLAALDLDTLSDEELRIVAHSYPDHEQVVCDRRIRMGRLGDGGWEICDDADVRPVKPCVIYSFGINYDFSFDDDASALYECQVYSFDPSMSGLGDQVNRSDRVTFYKIGLDNRTFTNPKQWSMYTYADIRKLLGHSREDICLVKMDIEGSERPALRNMLENGELDGVRQLLMEYHLGSWSRADWLVNLRVMQLVEKAGFKTFYSHKNPACPKKIEGYPVVRTNCYEVHYLRR